MERSLFSLVRSSIEQGYLPQHWHALKHKVISTFDGNLSLSDLCVRIDNEWYHIERDADELVYDEVNNKYILEEDSILVYSGRNQHFYTVYTNSENYYKYEGSYYTLEGLDAHDLVKTIDNEIAHHNDVYYWESDQFYHREEEPENYNDEIWGYHYGPCPPDYRNSPNEPGIGFEIEKGEDPVFCGFGDKEELFEHTGCVMEADSTVDWELKTPIYPLFSTDIEGLWLPMIASAINAADHEDAGGHIHLSMPPKNGKQLFEYCRPYIPLFMAMYPKRLESDYCKGKVECALKGDSEKHQAIQIISDRIELRFPAKVYDMNAIVFRLNYCRQMILHEYASIQAVTLAAFNQQTALGKLIIQQYQGREQMMLDRIIAIAKQYFNVNLLNEKNIEKLFKNLKSKKSCV